MAVAWSGFPVAEDVTELNVWQLIQQFDPAFDEIGWILASEHGYNRVSVAWGVETAAGFTTGGGYSGFVTSFVASGDNYILTDTGRGWAANDWFEYDNPANPDRPTHYDVVIECSTALPHVPIHKVVRAKILASPAGDTVTVEGGPIKDAVAARQIASTNLAGFRYVFQRQHTSSHPSIFWNDRQLEWPNAKEHATGTTELPTLTSITDSYARWGSGQFNGKDLMTQSGGRLKRIVIVNTLRNPDGTGTLTFATQPAAPDAGIYYAVVDHDAVWAPNRPVPQPFWWNRGIDRSREGILSDPTFYSHHRLAGLQPTPVVAMTVLLDKPNEDNTDCVETSVDALDEDVWSKTQPDEDCDVFDRPYSPHAPKTLRWKQAYLEGVCTAFVNKRVNWHAKNVTPQNYVPATLFKGMNANSYAATVVYTTTVSTAVASGNGYITFPAITLPSDVISGEVLPLWCHYAIIGDDDEPIQYGHSYGFACRGGFYPTYAGELVSTTRINLRGATIDEADEDPVAYPKSQEYMDDLEWAGKTLVIAFGWDRAFERQARYAYDKWVFVAPDGVDPPNSGNPGSYIKRDRSTRYAESGVNGTTSDASTPVFVNGDLVRIIGDQWHHPTTDDSVQDGLDPDAATRDAFYAEARARPVGQATEASSWYVRDSSRSEEGDTSEKSLWQPHGIAYTDGGTATGGTNATLIDTSKAGSGFWSGTTGRQVGFVLEVKDDAGFWVRRPITAFVSGTQTITVSPVFPFTTAGREYRVREPHVLNDYKSRLLLLWYAGLEYRIPIAANDDDTFYFADVGFIIPVGTLWTIVEIQPGEVMQWHSASVSFIKPTPGADPRGGADIRHDRRENCPTLVRRFGRKNKGDLITAKLLNCIFGGNNELAHRGQSGAWNIEAEDENLNIGGEIIYSDDPELPSYREWSTVKSEADAGFNTGTGASSVSLQLPGAGKYLFHNTLVQRNAQTWASHSDCVVDIDQTSRIQHKAAVYIKVSKSDFKGSGNNHFDAQGYNVAEDKWGKVTTFGPSTNTSERIRIGDSMSLPPNWPPIPTDTGVEYGWITIESPYVVIEYDFEGGRQYREP